MSDKIGFVIMIRYDDIFIDCTKYGTKLKTDLYEESGLNIIVDQGQKEIAGFTNETEGIYNEVPAIIFGDHTRIIKYVDKPFFLGADGTKILKSKLDNPNYKYLYYYLKNQKIPNTGYNRHYKWLKELQFDIHKEQEQIKIVRVLDDITQIISEKNKQLELLDELVKSRFIELFGDIEKYPNKVELQELCLKITDGSHNPPQGIGESNNYMISSQNIHDNIIEYKDVRYLSDLDFEKEDKRTNIKPGDVLLTIVGAIGRSAVVKDELNVTCQRSVCVIHPDNNKVNPVFLKYMLDGISGTIINEARGAAQKGIYLNQVKKLDAICPDMRIQNQFAEFVEKVNKSKFDIQRSIKTTQELFDSLMQEYFG